MATIDEVYFPFDAVEVEGEYDRVYSAKDFANYFKQFLTNGVYPNPSTNLQVQSLYGNMVVTVLPGSCFINGYCYILNENLNVTISESNAAYNRIDAVVAQLNHTERCIRILYKEGTPSASPVVPTLIRNDDVYEIRLAQVLVKSGVVKILDSEITDTRLSTTVCGVVTSLVDQVATETLYNQYVSYLNQQMAAWNTTKAQQATDFNNQMTAQQTTFNQIKSEWEAWVAQQQTESTHNHDARYYTKTESDNNYLGKTSAAASVKNAIKLKNASGTVVSYTGASAADLSGGVYYASTSGTAANSTKFGGYTFAQVQEMINKAGDYMGKTMSFLGQVSGNTQSLSVSNSKGGIVRFTIETDSSSDPVGTLVIDGTTKINSKTMTSYLNKLGVNANGYPIYELIVPFTSSAKYTNGNPGGTITGIAYLA